MSEDDAIKKAILARRAKFVAAAVASVGIACGKTTKEDAPPVPCLSVPMTHDAGRPEPCLAVPLDYDASQPMPCLSVAMPKDAGATDADTKPKGTP